MASGNEVKVVFTGDTSNLFDAADKVEARMRSVASEAEKFQGQTAGASRASTKLRDEFTNVTASAQRVSRDFQLAPKVLEARAATEQLANAFEAVGNNIKPGIGEFTRFVGMIGPAGLAIATIGGVAIGATKLITDQIRINAEARLKTEEKIVKALNKQYLEAQKINQAIAESRRTTEAQIGFDKTYGEKAPASRADQQRQLQRLEAEIDRLTNRNLLGVAAGDGAGNIARTDQLKLASERRNELLKLQAANQSKPSDQWNTYGQRLADRQAAEKEAQDKLNQSIAEGRRRVEEYGRAWRSVADNLIVSTSDNPFVRLFAEGEQSIIRLREQTKGLSQDLRQQFEQMQAQQNALAVFSQRVDSAFTAQGFRDMADRFRNGGPSGSMRLADAMSANTNADAARLQNFRETAERLRRANLPVTFGINDQARLDHIRRRVQLEDKLRGEDGQMTAQERLDRQLGLANSFRPGNDRERGVIDQRILSIAATVNPNDLRADQREAIAKAAENQATRVEKREQEAMISAQNREGYLKSINERLGVLNEAAGKTGLKGVETLITVKDETEAGVSSQTRQGTASDVNTRYPVEVGFFGGSNR